MSRTNRGSKHSGYEYWSKRPMCYSSPSKWAKKVCHKIERLDGKHDVYVEIQKLNEKTS